MEDTIATASVSLLRIKQRKYTHFAYRAIQKLVPGESPESTQSILLYPSVESREELGNLCNRLGWYLPEGTIRDCTIHLPLDGSLNLTDATQPPAQAEYPTDHLPITTHERDECQQIASTADRILIWDKTHRFDRTVIANVGKVEFIDPTYYSGIEPSTWLRITNAVRTPLEDRSRENFHALEEHAEDSNTSYVFATGPSLDQVFEFDIPDDALTIICNSIVRNDDMLEHIQPDVLVFADPIFHFGPSRYASEFRKDAAKTLREYNCMAIAPQQKHSLIAGHYPEFQTQGVGVESVSTNQPIYPNHEQLKVKQTNNIMTLLMLPIASALTDTVNIIGADGRKEDESYFWEHSTTAQYNDELMQTAAETHPSFFRDRVYEDYYEQHVETLTEMLEFGESEDIDYHSLTDSYIPCLRKRRSSPESPRNPEHRL